MRPLALQMERYPCASFWRATLLALLTVVGACATVAPYERERLAAPAMQLESDPMAAEIEQHVHEYREGTAGGFGGAGGGCGCN